MTENIRITEVQEMKGMTVRMTVANDRIGECMGKIFGEVAEHAQKMGAFITGPPFAYYHSYDPDKTDMECGFPVMEHVGESGRVKAFTIPAGRVVTAIHIGPYDRLLGTYMAMEKFIQQNGLEMSGPVWEVYVSDPQQVEPSDLITQVYWMIN